MIPAPNMIDRFIESVDPNALTRDNERLPRIGDVLNDEDEDQDNVEHE